MILIVDFGSQTTHLIARRLKDFGCSAKIIEPSESLILIKNESPKGIILSGGPASVYEKGAPLIDKKIFGLDIPILGICYGFQLTAKLLGGKVLKGNKEYGPALLRVTGHKSPITDDLPGSSTIWMSHGDEVVELPPDFKTLGSSGDVKFAFVENSKKRIWGIQFHPEVEHTKQGKKILKNFIKICEIKTIKQKIDVESLIEKIRKTVRDKHVIGAVSGGVDSTVAGVLCAKALGDKFTPVYVDNGLQRDDAKEIVKKVFAPLGIRPVIADVKKEMLELLRGKTDGIEKRKIIGAFFIEVFEREMRRLIRSDKKASFLLQGTIYSDVIESKGTKYASQIRVHHNVAGLPEKMKLELLEPLREFYKDEVRMIGKRLGVPEELIMKQTFPGPGFAVRIRGEVTEERLLREKQADKIVLEELRKAEWLEKVFMSFAVLTGASSSGTKGDGKFFGEVVALRIIESSDVMSTNWSRLPYGLLQKISSRIVNEVPGVSRVVYDITTKPPATMEWE